MSPLLCAQHIEAQCECERFDARIEVQRQVLLKARKRHRVARYVEYQLVVIAMKENEHLNGDDEWRDGALVDVAVTENDEDDSLEDELSEDPRYFKDGRPNYEWLKDENPELYERMRQHEDNLQRPFYVEGAIG